MPSLIGGGGGIGGPCRVAGFGRCPQPMADFYIPRNQPPRYRITGVTYDKPVSEGGTGLPLANCAVQIYEKVSGMLRGVATSDANGNYSLDVTSNETGLTFKADAYLPGSPDVAGTTVNTLVGTPA